MRGFLTMSLLFGDTWDTRDISLEKDLKEFRTYCHSAYQFMPKMENYNLEKLLVVFRHGARAPVRNLTKAWRSQACVACSLSGNTISDCQRKECSEGELTRRGFDQMVGLGKFIKQSYKSLLFDRRIRKENIKMRATKIPRTHSSLAGVVKGLTGDTVVENVEIPKDNDTLLNTLGCTSAQDREDATRLFDKPSISQDSKDFPLHQKPQERADHYYASLCSRVAVDCKELNCETEAVVDHIKAANDVWALIAGIGARGKESRRAVFGRFAKDLLADIGEDKQILLYSAHDSSVGAILAGLDTGVTEWPSYASALFVEIWCNTGKQYVRLVLNNKVLKPRASPNEYIPIRDFIALLKDIMPPTPARARRNPAVKATEKDIEPGQGASGKATNPR